MANGQPITNEINEIEASLFHKDVTVTRSNDLVQSSYFLTLNERRLIECSIAKIRNGQPIPSVIKVSADEFSEVWGIPKSNAFKELKIATSNLRDRLIKMRREDLKEDWEIRWVDAIGYQSGQGYVKLSFSQHIRPYLQQLIHGYYTKYRLAEIKHLNSVHAIRLYELIMQFRKTGCRTDTVENFREFFGIEGKYPQWGDFSKWVIKKACAEINKATDYYVYFDVEKKKNKAYRVTFFFHLKDQLSLELQ
ncbi:replication initiation protein [Methylophaga sp.]|uniref:replication initiation protein n=1 Tax=Methylophaga sp. TaxID=2024840 RepID=UPI003A9450DB